MRSWSPTLLWSLSVLALTVSGCSCGAAHERDVDAAAVDARLLAAVDAAAVGDAGHACPDGIMPWSPEDPANACGPEGRTCFSGGSVCGSALSCECTGGFWNCAVAEPDPACWCGREPAEGSPCTEEGSSCGSCCPSEGMPTFGPFVCTSGVWQAQDCVAVECPPSVLPACPAERVLGTPCATEGQSCGDPCCSAQTCVGGVWMPGPDADCLCDPSRSFACGAGSCTGQVACTSQCGPDDGIEHLCVPLPLDCASCDCTPLAPGQTCEVRDGRVFVSDGGFCG